MSKTKLKVNDLEIVLYKQNKEEFISLTDMAKFRDSERTNYHIHTDAVKNFIIPERNYEKDKEWLLYAEEADLLNVVLFNCTAKDWREANPDLARKLLNIN